MIITPLEQFQIVALLPLSFLNFDFSLTNFLVITLLNLLIFIVIFYYTKSPILKTSTLFLVPNNWQMIVEIIYDVVFQLIFDNVSSEGEKYTPYISTVFIFILFNNLIGLIPYSFTVTSHIFVTFTLSFSIFFGLNIVGFKKHNLNMFSLIIPANSTTFLALILVPIEFVSYLAKPISLGVRLFINLMAGHTLLKVIVGFSWAMLVFENLFLTTHIIPLVLLVLLMGLELGVALIQTYVFIILTCIYLNDSIRLH